MSHPLGSCSPSELEAGPAGRQAGGAPRWAKPTAAVNARLSNGPLLLPVTCISGHHKVAHPHLVAYLAQSL